VEQVTIVITETAYIDLQEIENYISQDSPAIARKFINRIFDKIDQLYKFPESGKAVPEINDKSVKELLINRYRIIYQITDAYHISIVRIVHGARLLDIEV
jgi:toxin ParE1/3/4